MITIESVLKDTDPKHSDMIDAFAYAIAEKEASLMNSYFLVYIKNRPKYIPLFLYRFIIKKVVHLAEFRIKK